MQCYTQVVPPTAVTHAISLSLLSPTANNLVVAKASLIQVFALKSIVADDIPETPVTPVTSKRQRKERSYITKLILVGQYQLSGTITGLGKVKPLRSKSGGELLVVAVRDAKLSVVQWDPAKYSIATVSIHYYEREDLQGAPWAPSLGQFVTHLTVDPGNRCAAYKFGARHIAILPFHQKGDELAIDDMGPYEETQHLQQQGNAANGEDDAAQTPYAASFVLSLLMLDPALLHPIHVAFLHGYREPTLGVLSSQQIPSASLLAERRDPISFTVYTLDLEQKASTPLLSVTGLPYDMARIIPLPNPVGGTLLMSNNAIIHIDQSGKAYGIAVNDFAKETTDFPLVSQSDLGMKLEGSVIEHLSGSPGQMLIVLSNGRLALLKFQTDGRAVSSIVVEPVPSANGGDLLQAPVCCAAVVGRGRLFLGSEASDSVVLGWTSKTIRGQRPVSAEEDDLDADLYGESEDENDIYAESSKPNGRQSKAIGISVAAADYSFRVHDALLNLAPLRNLRTIHSHSDNSPDNSTVDLIGTTGNGRKGALTRLRPEIALEDLRAIRADASAVWSFHVNGPLKRTEGKQGHTNTVMVRNRTDGETHVYEMAKQDLRELSGSGFDPSAGPTVDVHLLAGGTRVLQVLPNELRTFDGDFALDQIVPIADETENGPNIIAASVAEPYMLLIRDDRSIIVLRMEDSGEIEEVTKAPSLSQTQWQSGALYDDADDAFHLPFEIEEAEDVGTVLMFMLGCDGSLHVFRPPYFSKPLYVAAGLGFLPPYLTPEFTLGRGRTRSQLNELLIARLGDEINQPPYLILRTSHDDVILYQPYQDSTKPNDEAALQFFRTINHHIPKLDEAATEDETSLGRSSLRAVQLTSGLAAVFVTGRSPRMVIKNASCDPQVIGFKHESIQHIAACILDEHDQAIFVDGNGQLSTFNLPQEADFSTGWVTQKVYTDAQIVAFDYHPTRKRMIIGTSSKVDFRLPQDDELHPEWREETTTILPEVDHDMLKLYDPATQRITDTYELEPYEVVLCIKVVPMEVSEQTHERREVVCVGTAIIRGEDLLTHGCIYIFDIAKVVPEPDHPETGRKFKLLSKVKDRGAVTAVTGVGSEGFLLVAHGQKCYVRGLKEDGSLLPVAFLDTQCYVSVAKELKGTNMIMLGDAIKGLWFVGYSEDPYSMKVFGKGNNRLEIASAEYLPEGEDLYILATDADGVLYTYKFDPLNPKSLSGQRLLLLSTFNTGAHPVSTMLLPRTTTAWDRLYHREDSDAMDTSSSSSPAGFQVLSASADGSLALLTTLSASAYRTLSALQSYLTTTLPHPLGLNPKGYRAVDADLTVGGRAIIDGDVLKRWLELGSWKQAESVARVGLDSEWEVRALLESVGERGLGYL